jgi:hypothetical protein
VVRIVRKIGAVLLPAAPDPGHERRLGHLLALHPAQHLYDEGLLADSFMMEFLQSHTNVVAQPPYNSRWFGGINPYALGFAMWRDIRRICEDPDDEDRRWFPEIAGSDWLETFDFAMRNFKDESFIAQYLSPKPDARLPPVRGARRRPRGQARGLRHPRRRPASASCARSSPTSTTWARANPTCRCGTSTCAATARSPCATLESVDSNGKLSRSWEVAPATA